MLCIEEMLGELGGVTRFDRSLSVPLSPAEFIPFVVFTVKSKGDGVGGEPDRVEAT